MAENKKWVQNTYATGIQINLLDENGVHEVKFIFNAYKIDKITGKVITDGFTVLSDEELKALKESKSFNKCLDEGKLVVYDEPPAAALSDIDRMLLLQEEVRNLKAENATLRKQLEALAPKADGTPAKQPNATKQTAKAAK